MAFVNKQFFYWHTFSKLNICLIKFISNVLFQYNLENLIFFTLVLETNNLSIISKIKGTSHAKEQIYFQI